MRRIILISLRWVLGLCPVAVFLTSLQGCDLKLGLGRTNTVNGTCPEGCSAYVQWGDGGEPEAATAVGAPADGEQAWQAEHVYTQTVDDITIECSCDGGNTWYEKADVDVILPTGESTAFFGWTGPHAVFNVTLEPSGDEVLFEGCEVREEDSGGGIDTCWRDDDQLPWPGWDAWLAFVPINGLVFQVDRFQDTIGWNSDKIVYYQAIQGRCPCGAYHDQKMFMANDTTADPLTWTPYRDDVQNDKIIRPQGSSPSLESIRDGESSD